MNVWFKVPLDGGTWLNHMGQLLLPPKRKAPQQQSWDMAHVWALCSYTVRAVLLFSVLFGGGHRLSPLLTATCTQRAAPRPQQAFLQNKCLHNANCFCFSSTSWKEKLVFPGGKFSIENVGALCCVFFFPIMTAVTLPSLTYSSNAPGS